MNVIAVSTSAPYPKLSRWAAAAFVAVAFLTPLVIAPDLVLFSDVTPKVVVILLGTALAVMTFDAGTLSAIIRSKSLGRLFVLTLAVQAASVAVSTVFSHDFGLSLAGTNWRRFGLLTQLAIIILAVIGTTELARSPSTYIRLLRAVSLAGVAACAYGILEYAATDTNSLPFWQSLRSASSLGHPVYFANYLASIVFISLGHNHLETRRPWKVLGAFAVFLALIGIALSGTRAAILGVVVAGGILLPQLHLRRRLWQFALAVGGLTLGVLYLSPSGAALRNRLGEWVLDYRGGTRLFLWRDSLRMFTGAWPVGYGPETFSTLFPRFQSGVFARTFPNAYNESPHNILIDAGVSQGLPGVLILVTLIGLGYAGCRLMRTTDVFLANCLQAALTACLVAHQFACFTATTAAYFYLILVVIWAPNLRSACLNCQAHESSRWRNRTRLAFAAVVMIFAVELVVTDVSLKLIHEDLQQGRFQTAIARYARMEPWRPPGFSADLWYSRKLMESAQIRSQLSEVLDAATAAAVRATLRAEDRHNAWYNLALLYSGQGNLLDAEVSARKCIEMAPNWFKPYWLLSEIYHASGRAKEALSIGAKAVELDGERDPEVRMAYEAMTRELGSPR